MLCDRRGGASSRRACIPHLTSDRHDVIVVGAGPAGSTTARHLADRGHDVVLIDKNEGPRSRIACTGIVSREAYDELDLPRTPVIDTIRMARFFSPAGVEVTYEPRDPLGYVVDRTKLDGALAARAREAGATLLGGYRARAVEKGRGGVTLTVENGDVRTLHARALVVATGYHRRLHETAGLGRAPAYVNGVSADLPFHDLEATELYFGNEVAPGFFAWAVPFGPGFARLGVLAPRGGRAFFEKFLRSEPIRSRLGVDLRNGGRAAARTRTLSRGIVQGAVVPSYADRVLAVGEAAGQIKTTTSGGIYYGMIGAGIAADVLSAALNEDRLDAAHLARYEAAWKGRLGEEIETGFELQRLGLMMSDPEIDTLFAALNEGFGATVRTLIQFDWHKPALKVLLRRKNAWRIGREAMSALGAA